MTYITEFGVPYIHPPVPDATPKPQPVTATPTSSLDVSQVQKVESDYSDVGAAQSAVTAAQRQLATAIGMVPHEAAQENLTATQKTLATAQSQLNTDLQPLLLPDQSKGYLPGAGNAQVTELSSVLTEPGMQGYIKTAEQSLQKNLAQLFGKPTDPNSLGAEIQGGNWTAAEHTEQQEITAAGTGATPAAQQAASAAFAEALLNFGPQTAQYQAGINQAFDSAVVQPMVTALNKTYANPASRLDVSSSNLNIDGFESRAGAFASAFEADMAASTPEVRAELLQDLLTEKNSPLLSVAAEIRSASNENLPEGTTQTLEYWRARAAGMQPHYARGPLPLPAGTDLWKISSTAELGQVYSDLSAATDLAAVGDITGTGTGMINQVAQAILGDPNSGRPANLPVLSAAIQNAAANGNVNLSTEIAGILFQSGKTKEASAVLTSLNTGVGQLEKRIDQDVANLKQLPKSLKIPVETVASLYSDPQTTVNATTKLLNNNPSLLSQVQAKLKTDLAALDVDGQAVVRLYTAVDDMSPALAALPQAATLTNTMNQLIATANAQFAISGSPTAQAQLTFQGQQLSYAEETLGTIPGQEWAAQRGFQYLPPGVLWVGRDVTAYYQQIKASGKLAPLGFLSAPGVPASVIPAPLNVNPTGNVAQQINTLAQSVGVTAPVNIEAVQAEIFSIKQRMAVLNLGGKKIPSPAATKQINTLQALLDSDPDYQAVKALQGQLALTNDPAKQLSILNKIATINAKSVNEQASAIEGQAHDDPAVMTELSGLTTDYSNAQKTVASINTQLIATQTPATAAALNKWVNRAGQLANTEFESGGLDGTALGAALSDLDPTVRSQLLAGTLVNPAATLPPEVLSALQQNATISKSIGTGPKGGLLVNSADGTLFNMLDLTEKFGGAFFLGYLGFTRPDQDNLNKQFSAGVFLFSVAPSAAQFAGGLTQQLIGADVTSIPGIGDGLTNLLATGGKIDTVSLFAQGIGNGAWTKTLGAVSSVAWTGMMYEWAFQEFQSGHPIPGAVVTTIGTSYLLPLVTDSAWAGPASAAIDVAGILYILGNTIYQTNQAINEYSGTIDELLKDSGLKPDVAAALARPDDQGIAAAVRMGQIFDATPYYNTSNQQLNDTRRIAYLNALTPDQASLLGDGLINIPLNSKTGQMAATGAMNLDIAPPSASLGPAAVQQYYDSAYSALGLAAPPDPGIIAGVGVPKNEYLDYYEMYTAGLAESGRAPDAGLIWSDLYANRNDTSPDNVSVFPTSIQGFIYFADSAGMPLQGATP